MAFIDRLSSLFKRGSSSSMYFLDGARGKIQIKELVTNQAINLIARTLAVSEIRTFKYYKEVKGENYYLLNVEPNNNDSASVFWQKVVSRLIRKNEVLIVMRNNSLWVADSFIRRESINGPALYSSVVVNNIELIGNFSESQVIYLKLNNEEIYSYIKQLTDEMEELINYSMKTYKRSNATRGILKVDASYPQTEEAHKKLDNLVNNNFKSFLENENGGILPISSGLQYTDLTNQTYKNGSDSRDIRLLIDDSIDMISLAFGIPTNLLRGNAVDEATKNQFFSQTIRPIKEMLEDEINRKLYGKQDFLSGSYAVIDTTQATIGGIKDLAETIDILTRNGVNTVNDNLKMLGRPPIKDGDKRYITLNLEKETNDKKEDK